MSNEMSDCRWQIAHSDLMFPNFNNITVTLPRRCSRVFFLSLSIVKGSLMSKWSATLMPLEVIS